VTSGASAAPSSDTVSSPRAGVRAHAHRERVRVAHDEILSKASDTAASRPISM
jgi:hypothetical protein